VKVLQVNKFFRPGAGAETSFHQTRELLQRHGHEVVDFATRHPDNLPSPYEGYFAAEREYNAGGTLRRARDAAASVYSWEARKALRRLLADHRPDVAHLHNVYHQLTLSVVDELHAQGVPTVLTLHDWKVACPAYTLFTEGAPCRRCPTQGVHQAVVHRCVKGSRLASGVAALEATVAHRRGTYGRIGCFISPSRFGIDVAELGGIPRERVHYVPNFLTDAELAVPVAHDAGPVLLYAGRLEATKGVRQLLAAFADVPAPAVLRIAGDGPLAGDVRAAAAANDRIEFLGRVPREQLLEEYGRARAVVLPSIWEDNGPFVLLEAQARGRALIVTDRGGPPEFVDHEADGLVVDPLNHSELARAMTRVSADGGLAERFGNAGRERVLAEHGELQHYERLLTVYGRAMEDPA
jgi:glycosyltransferase involved in cell wall biosynthesis